MSNDHESVLILVYDVVSSTASTQELIDIAFDNGYGLISYPLIDKKNDNSQLIKDKHIKSTKSNDNDDESKDINDHFNNNVLSNIPFNYFEDSSSEIFQSVYGKISSWIRFDNNSSNKNIEYNSSYHDLLQHELDWCLHLGIFWVILPPPQQPKISQSNEKEGGQPSNEEKKNGDTNDNECQLEIAVNYASAIIAAFAKRETIVGIVPITFDQKGWQLWSSLSILFRDTKNVRPGMFYEKSLILSLFIVKSECKDNLFLWQ